jgi:hypothetical protein
LKEEGQDRTLWRTQFGRGYEPVTRQTTTWTWRINAEAVLFTKQIIWSIAIVRDDMSIINGMASSCEHGNDYSPFLNGEDLLDQSVTLNLPTCVLLHGVLANMSFRITNIHVMIKP